MEGIELEGIRGFYPSTYNFNGSSTFAANGASQGTQSSTITANGYGAQAAKAWWINNIHIYLSHDTYIQFLAGTANSFLRQPISAGTHDIQINKVIFPVDGISTSLWGPVEGANNILFTWQVDAYAFSADMNYGAKDSILVIGDSNTEGGSVAVSGVYPEDLWHHKLKNWLLDRGESVRLIDKSIGGKSSTSYYNYMKQGKLYLPEAPKYCIINLGTNDGGDGATYKTNIRAIVTFLLRHYPDIKIVLTTPFPASSGSASETNSALIRTAAAELYASDYSTNRNIFLHNFASALPITNNDTYFYTGDGTTSGNRIHLNKAGQTKVYESIQAFWQTNLL
jgi:lysophospholipase L1-like esterase